MVAISICHGHETRPDQNCGFMVEVFNPDLRTKTALGTAILDEVYTAVRRNGQAAKHASSEGRSYDLGMWHTTPLDIAEGTILDLIATSRSARTGSEPKTVRQLVRVRANAALRRISMALPQATGRLVHTAHVYGRFDTLTLDQAISAGLIIHPKLHPLYRAEPTTMLDFAVIEAEVAPVPVVVQTTVLDAADNPVRVGVRGPRRAVRGVAKPIG